MGKKNYVCVPRDEYDELIECKLHISTLYRFITKRHESCIKMTGFKQKNIDMKDVELACGYSDNERYFAKLQKEFKEKEKNT